MTDTSVPAGLKAYCPPQPNVDLDSAEEGVVKSSSTNDDIILKQPFNMQQQDTDTTSMPRQSYGHHFISKTGINYGETIVDFGEFEDKSIGNFSSQYFVYNIPLGGLFYQDRHGDRQIGKIQSMRIRPISIWLETAEREYTEAPKGMGFAKEPFEWGKTYYLSKGGQAKTQFSLLNDACGLRLIFDTNPPSQDPSSVLHVNEFNCKLDYGQIQYPHRFGPEGLDMPLANTPCYWEFKLPDDFPPVQYTRKFIQDPKQEGLYIRGTLDKANEDDIWKIVPSVVIGDNIKYTTRGISKTAKGVDKIWNNGDHIPGGAIYPNSFTDDWKGAPHYNMFRDPEGAGNKSLVDDPTYFKKGNFEPRVTYEEELLGSPATTLIPFNNAPWRELSFVELGQVQKNKFLGVCLMSMNKGQTTHGLVAVMAGHITWEIEFNGYIN